MDLPEHMSPAEVAKLLRVDEAEIQAQIDRGSIRLEEGRIPKSEVQAMLLLKAMRHDTALEYVEGRGATNQHLPERVCDACGDPGGVHYVGTTVLDGSLEYYHLMHTEVEHHFRCALCSAQWRVFKML